MKHFGVMLIVLTFPFSIFSAFEDMESGPRPEALGGAFTAISDDVNAIHFNPAGLFLVREKQLTAFYKKPYGVVNNATFNAVLPTSYGTFGFSFQSIYVKGEETNINGESLGEKTLENEMALTVSYGGSLNKDLSYGCNVVGYQLTQARFGTANTFGIDIGVLADIYDRWRLGFFAHNINSPQLGSEKKHNLPRLLSLGLSFSPFNGVTSSVDLSKEVGKDTRFAFGQEFSILKNLTLRAGVSTEPIRASFGVGLSVQNFLLDYSVVTHEVLPLTHIFGLTYKL